MNNNENMNEKAMTPTEEPLHFFLDGTIDDEDVVTVSRDEYSEMVAECTILHVVETLVKKHGKDYNLMPYLHTILSIGDEDVSTNA